MYKNKLCFAVFLLFFSSFINSRDALRSETERVVTTSVGSFQGSLDIDNGYYKFLGIPYGLVNEENPFGHSTAYPAIEGVFLANNDTVTCAQATSDGEIIGEKDCLNLRVYVPVNATATSRLPVVIWVHGGYFMRGGSLESQVGPKYLVRHDVIFVAMNYRVGPFGFMCLGIDTVPGNQGLKDQHLAIEWVKNNIEAFGGNPDDITLAGNSAGAHSIDLHLYSKKDSLYNKVILQSGSALTETVLLEADRVAAIKIAEHIGIPANSSRQALSQLAHVDAHRIVKAADELKIMFKPCVEAQFDGVDPFITHSWIHDMPEKVANLSVLIGTNEYERLLYYILDPEYYSNLNIFNERLNKTFDFMGYDNEGRIDKSVNTLEGKVDIVRRFYLGDDAISQDTVWPVITFDSDFVYHHPLHRTVKRYLRAGAANIYQYVFLYSGGRNHHVDHNNVSIESTTHRDEMFYLFTMSQLSDVLSVEDQLIVDRMTAMWTNFVKYGNPTPQTTALLPVQWTPVTNEIHHYIKIESNLTMDRRPMNRRMAFWDLFYSQNDGYQRVFDSFYDTDDASGHGRGGIIQASFISLLFTMLVITQL